MGAAPRTGRKWTSYILPGYTWLVVVYLMLPIFVMILFGFNDTGGGFNFRWQGFTLEGTGTCSTSRSWASRCATRF